MNFQSLPKVEKPDFYLDVAFRMGKAKAASLPKRRNQEAMQKLIGTERTRIEVVGGDLRSRLHRIVTSYPQLTDLPPFYEALVKATLDYGELRRSLGGVNWAVHRIEEFTRMYSRKISGSRRPDDVYAHKTAFYGRVSSAVKQIKPELALIEEARKVMKTYPHVKTSLHTVVVAGYPNVGKTTLLRALTGSEPKIASYPFTTQQLMMGYYSHRDLKYQVIDTPGMLDRPLSEMNKIEKQAVLALRYLKACILFLIDPTETCGYSLEEQLSLLKQVQKNFDMPLLVAANKADVDAAATKRAKEQVDDIIVISAQKGTGILTLRRQLSSACPSPE